MAQRSDRHLLHEDAVQCVEAEIDFVDDTYRQLRGRKAKWLREDFCGTANTSCEWVRRRRINHAIGVDLDADVQQWSRKHHLAELTTKAREHIELINASVMGCVMRARRHRVGDELQLLDLQNPGLATTVFQERLRRTSG